MQNAYMILHLQQTVGKTYLASLRNHFFESVAETNGVQRTEERVILTGVWLE